MKKILYLILCVLIAVMSVSTLAFAEEAPAAEMPPSEAAEPEAAALGVPNGANAPAPIAAVTLSVDNPDFITLMPDRNFRQAVLDSMSAAEKEGATVADILNSFPGVVNAKNKGITGVKGLEQLKHAEKVDLTGNQIKDLTSISASGAHSTTYYGYAANDPTMAADREEGSNVYWIINKNPIENIPADFGGLLVIAQPGSSSYTYQFDPSADTYSFIRETGSERFDLDFLIGRCKVDGGSFVELLPNTLSLLKMTEDTEKPESALITAKLNIPHKLLSAAESPSGKPNEYARINEILLNQDLKMGVGTGAVLHYWTADEYGFPTGGSQSLKYYQDFRIRIYDRVKLTHHDTGTASLEKKDAVTGAPLMGAVYDLYKGDTLYKSGLTTNIDGQIVVRDLQAGQYSFRETKAPEGYILDKTSIPVTIKDPVNAHGNITGGVANQKGDTVTATDGTVSAPLLEDEMFIAGSDTPDMALTVTGGEFGIVVDYSGLAMSRQPGKMDPEPITRIFSSAEEARADINAMKNAGRIAGPVTIDVEYSPAVIVTAVNQPQPTGSDPTPPPAPSPTGGAPKTGDPLFDSFYILMCVAAGIAILAVVFVHKRCKKTK